MNHCCHKVTPRSHFWRILTSLQIFLCCQNLSPSMRSLAVAFSLNRQHIIDPLLHPQPQLLQAFLHDLLADMSAAIVTAIDMGD